MRHQHDPGTAPHAMTDEQELKQLLSTTANEVYERLSREMSAAITAAKEETRARFWADKWEQWKQWATPELRAYAHTIETCPACTLGPWDLHTAFRNYGRPDTYKGLPAAMRGEYRKLTATHRDRGPRAAEFAEQYRTRHTHGPGRSAIARHFGLPGKDGVHGSLTVYFIHRLYVRGWLENEHRLPWGTRPGRVAEGAA